MLEKNKELVKKIGIKKSTIIKLCIAFIISCCVGVIFEYKFYAKIDPFTSKNRIILIAMATYFVLLHFIIKLETMYGFIYRNRYKIACAFLLFVMIGGYSGSSITFYNYIVQSDIDNGRYHTLLGAARSARSDEWGSSTDYILSQGMGDNKFEYFSNKLRGTTTDMFTLVGAPVKDILMLGRPFQIGFLLFGNSFGLSFYWYIRLVAMALGAFELCMIVSNKNKRVSLIGMIIITFSSAVQWWYCLDTLIWAQIILVLFNKFFETDKKWVKYLSAFGILVGLLSYVFNLYPAWQVPFAYFMLAMGIWILLKNSKTYKINLHDIIVIAITLICFALLLFRWYSLSHDAIFATMNTAYPGERREIGGGSLTVYSYVYDIFTSIFGTPDACEFSSMLSFFPVPYLLAIFYLARNRKKENAIFIIPMVLVSMFIGYWCWRGFPDSIAKYTLMSMSTANRAGLVLGTINIYILIFLLGRITKEDKWMHWSIATILGILATGYVVYKGITIQPAEGYYTKTKIIISGILFLISFICIFNMNKKTFQTVFMFSSIFIALASGLIVNPIIRTTDIIYTKPVSVKIAEIRNSDPEAIWIGESVDFHVSNFMVANGIRTLNSTSVYPNVKFFEEYLGERANGREYEYNRYCHNVVFLTNEVSDISLVQMDKLVWNMNYKDLEKFNVDYILTSRNLNRLGFDKEFEMLYYEDGIYIFKVN